MKAITGSFFNPGPYAGFLACGIPPALYFFLKGKSNGYIRMKDGSMADISRQRHEMVVKALHRI